MHIVYALILTPLLAAQPDQSVDQGSEDQPHASNEGEEMAGESQLAAKAVDTDTGTGSKDRELEELRAQIKAMKEEYDARFEQLETEMFESGAQSDVESRLNIYGFFDIGLQKVFAEDDSLLDGLVNEPLTFVMQNINLFFDAQMTQDLSALLEFRFTFLPLGNELGFEAPGMSEYEREDTSVKHPATAETFDLGGVAIERAHMTWQPADYFGVTAGYFLTPYGIWNVDHGSPVRTTIRQPYMQDQRIMPLSQLGLQLFGRLFPARRTYFDYAFTVSNGRGPISQVVDLDENKGLGLRAKLSWEGNNSLVSFGGYGYLGDYTDTKRTIRSVSPDFRVDETVKESYREYIGSLDLTVKLFGVCFQSEFIRRLALYNERPRRAQEHGIGFQPDYVTMDFYGLIGWELPLQRWLGSMILMPYFEVEHTRLDDSTPDTFSMIYIGGINFRPSPFVTLKAEATRLKSINTDDLDAWFTGIQMAVSF